MSGPAPGERQGPWSRELRAGPDTAAEARWFLWEVLRDRQEAVDLDVAALLTTELASNAARHGSERPGSPIEVSVSLQEEGLRVSVHDQGPGFDPDDENARGWGVKLVEALSSDWGLERGDRGTEVWFEI